MIKKRNIAKVYILGIVTFGIYFIYWYVKTKNELNELGANIPTAWLLIIPIANLYWLYKYADGFTQISGKDSTGVWFLIFLFLSIITPAIVQSELNKIAEKQAQLTPSPPPPPMQQ